MPSTHLGAREEPSWGTELTRAPARHSQRSRTTLCRRGANDTAITMRQAKSVYTRDSRSSNPGRRTHRGSNAGALLARETQFADARLFDLALDQNPHITPVRECAWSFVPR